MDKDSKVTKPHYSPEASGSLACHNYLFQLKQTQNHALLLTEFSRVEKSRGTDQ